MKFKHYKGGEYELVCFATHSETQEDLVVYKSLETGKVWVRPREMFFGKAQNKFGVEVPRFEAL